MLTRRESASGTTIAALVFAAALAGPPRPAGAAETPRFFYLKYCAACHGTEAKGDGIVGTFMRPKPSDLTQIAKRRGGQFPFDQVVRIIDGRNTLRAHGDPDMPVWGEVLREQAGSSLIGEKAEVQGTILIITDYLRSIQEGDPAAK